LKRKDDDKSCSFDVWLLGPRKEDPAMTLAKDFGLGELKTKMASTHDMQTARDSNSHYSTQLYVLVTREEF
jgi:hypothetical protein